MEKGKIYTESGELIRELKVGNESAFNSLFHGSVEVYTHTDQAFVLKPGEQACIEDGKISCREVNVRQFTSWIEGKFMFCNTALEEIGKQITIWLES